MDGGIICSCDEQILDQLGCTRHNWNNFYCKGCKKFVHLHYSDSIDGDKINLCADCDTAQENGGK